MFSKTRFLLKNWKTFSQTFYRKLITSKRRESSRMMRRVSNKKHNESLGVFCAHCKKSGERHQIYESHNLRDVNGRICCPKIKSTTCYKCYKIGHLPTYCVVAKKPLGTESPSKASEKKYKPYEHAEEPTASSGSFAALADDGDDETAMAPAKKAKSHAIKKRIVDWADMSDDDDDTSAPPV